MKSAAVEAAPPHPWREFWPRLLGRLRHGLLIQEILDRLARTGIVIYPYFIALENATAESTPVLAQGQLIRPLSAQDAAQMQRVDPRYPPRPFIARLSCAECLGMFIDSELVGYSWAKFDAAPIPGSLGAPLLALRPHEAYLFDIFVGALHRGRRLADIIRRAAHADLMRRGRVCFYSYTLAFNRSPRRLMARAGVRDLELRLYLGLGRRNRVGMDLRLWRRAPYLRTFRLTRVNSPRAPEPEAQRPKSF